VQGGLSVDGKIEIEGDVVTPPARTGQVSRFKRY